MAPSRAVPSDQTAKTMDGGPAAASPTPLAFDHVNKLFRKNYAEAKQEILRKLGPVIICTGDTITLQRGVTRESHIFIKPRYSGLKEIAHITLGTYVLLINHIDEKLSTDVMARLKEFKESIETAKAQLTNEGLEQSDFDNQEELIAKTLAFQDEVLKAGTVSRAELREYSRSVGALNLSNANGAASSQLDTIDGIVAKWRANMTPREWNSMYVIVVTGHMPRQAQASFQYFSRLLKQKVEGERIIVMESAQTNEQAVDLLLTHILDGDVAVDFFKDRWRMHRDLLSDGAKKHLSKQNKLKAER